MCDTKEVETKIVRNHDHDFALLIVAIRVTSSAST